MEGICGRGGWSDLLPPHRIYPDGLRPPVVLPGNDPLIYHAATILPQPAVGGLRQELGPLHPWIYHHYVEPILYDAGYNPVNTVTWALILGGMILLILRLLRRLEVSFDERFFLATAPYVLAGASLRVVEDAELVAAPLKYLLITPLIYFLAAAGTMTALLLCRQALGDRWLSGYAAVGLLWTAGNLALLAPLGVERSTIPIAILALGVAATALVAAGSRLISSPISGGQSLLILFAHMFDAASTYVGVDWFGYVEKHVVPSLLIEAAGTALVMFPLKLLILIPVLAVVEGALRDDPSLKNLTLFALLTLGLAPAVRNTIRLTLGI